MAVWHLSVTKSRIVGLTVLTSPTISQSKGHMEVPSQGRIGGFTRSCLYSREVSILQSFFEILAVAVVPHVCSMHSSSDYSLSRHSSSSDESLVRHLPLPTVARTLYVLQGYGSSSFTVITSFTVLDQTACVFPFKYDLTA